MTTSEASSTVGDAAVVVVAVFTPTAGQTENLVAAIRRGIPAVHDEAGCERYAIHDAGDTVVMIEKWSDSATFEAHRNGVASRRMAASVAPFLADPVRVLPMRPLPVGPSDKNL